MVSHGLRQPCSLVMSYGTRGDCKIFHVLTKWIELGEPMHRGTLLEIKMGKKNLSKRQKPSSLCHANVLTLGHAFMVKHTKPCFTKNGKNFPHPEAECRKNKQAKNE